jgi:lipoyl(octanoyl) transferase
VSLEVIVRKLSLEGYRSTWQAMKNFTDTRQADTLDEIWLLQHSPVFTQGQAGKAEHILNPGTIPVIQTDRGGQVTYHGPGQLIAYVLFNLHRLKIGIRQLVSKLEDTVIKILSDYGVHSTTSCNAPGVYVNQEKICSIGLRVRRGCSYHGIAFNIDMDLEPFTRINPCGFHNLAMTQLKNFCSTVNYEEVETKAVAYLVENFGYTQSNWIFG